MSPCTQVISNRIFLNREKGADTEGKKRNRDAVIAIMATVARQERIRVSERIRADLTTVPNKRKRLGRSRVFVSRSRIESLRREGRSWRDRAGAQYQHSYGGERTRRRLPRHSTSPSTSMSAMGIFHQLTCS
jgi:DNA invertase Pin-like site-specific DNA recombinase